MPEEFEDMPIDGEFDPETSRTPKKRRAPAKPVRKTATRRATPRRRAAPVAQEEEIEAPRARPRISIEAATHAPHKVNVYRRLSLTFFAATIAVIGVIAFFTFQRATISITQEPIPVATTFPVNIIDANAASSTGNLAPDTFQGIIVSVTTSTSVTATPSTTTDKPGKSHGVVTIVNQGKTAQSLIATTRFISDSGVLFRLSKGASVPAGGQVQAEIVADKPGAEGDIAPTHFVIPGLTAANQKIVYGQTTAPTTGGSSKIGVVTQSDIDAAKENARKALFDIGQDALASTAVPSTYEVLHTPVAVQADASVKAGDQTSAFTVTAQGTMAFVAYPKAAVYSAADTELSNHAPTPYHKVIYGGEAPTVSLQTLSPETQMAKLQIYREGRAVLDAHASAFQSSQFLGRTKQEITDMLTSIKGVLKVEISFFPFWVDHAPKVPSRITVNIE